MKKVLYPFAFILTFILLNACGSVHTNPAAVHPFEKDRYLGKWYEIARMDFKFEKDLNNTTAEYGIRNDGMISVTNRGYNYVKQEWTEATGRAKFVKEESTAMLKVSFFGPFFAGYNVIALDENYQYALVAGKDLDFLWILSRKPSMPEQIKNDYLMKAKDIGFKTDELIWVEHNE